MPSPSLVIALVEDERHKILVRKYLFRRGFRPHQINFVPFPAGKGSAEQWVRTRFATEVRAYRHRRLGNRAETALIVMIDADAHIVDHRLTQLADGLREAEIPQIQMDEPVARLVPRRNVETWIVCLNGNEVEELTDYKGTRQDWNELITGASLTLYQWTRPNAVVPSHCVDSLVRGIRELRRLEPSAA